MAESDRPGGSPPATSRAQRRAEALRANLRRRKEQARSRAEAPDSAATDAPSPKRPKQGKPAL